MFVSYIKACMRNELYQLHFKHCKSYIFMKQHGLVFTFMITMHELYTSNTASPMHLLTLWMSYTLQKQQALQFHEQHG